MKQTTETLVRASVETMERKPGEQMLSRCEAAKLALLKKPLPASVPCTLGKPILRKHDER